MSKLMTVPTMLPNKGIILHKPQEMLLEQYSPHSRNMEFYNELLQGRLGLVKFDSTELSGPILNIDQYWKFTSTWWLMVCTTKDIYAYDFDNTRWDILTPVYTTGTIEIAAGSLNVVTGSGTSWNANLKAGDFIKIGSGSIHTGSTWYEIQSVDSDTQLTLTGNAVETAPGAAYVARQTFSGASTNFWWSVTFQDTNLGETWIATNGVDTPVRWTGSGQVQALANLPTGFTTAKYVERFKDRLMFAWTVEGGSNQPQRERWSAVANCESWTDSDFHDFVDEDTWIMGIANYQDYHIVFKEWEAYIGRHVGGSDVFDYEKSTTCDGVRAAESITPKRDYIYYLGRDLEFKRWNLLREDPIGRGLWDETKNFDPNLGEYVYGWDAIAKHQIRWHCPTAGATYNDYTVAYDYEQEVLQVWEYQASQACMSIGDYLRVQDLYVDDATWGEYYVDEQDGYWDARYFEQNAEVVIYGGYDGYVREADSGNDDDGSEYTRTFRSVRMNFGLPDILKRLWRQEWWFEKEASGTVTLKQRRDDETSWDPSTRSIDLTSATKDIIKKKITWDKWGRSYQFQLDATNHFALLGWLNYLFPKRKEK